MALCYVSGEEIQKGDRVRLHGEPGYIEYVAEAPSGDLEADWNLTENGPGVMVIVFGRTYVRDTESDFLEFVGRAAD
jgi:hypothetical protein